jgi:hypothetical protein
MYSGICETRSVKSSVMALSIQLPHNTIISIIARNFGTNVSVCSCIEVIVWNMLIIRPIISETSRSGADVLTITQTTSLAISITTPSDIFIPPFFTIDTFHVKKKVLNVFI